MQDYIKTLEKKFDRDIVRSGEHIRGKNYYDVDKHGNIVKLYLFNVDLRSLDILLPISKHLVELTVQYGNIKSLKALKSFSNLEKLDLSGNRFVTPTLKNLNFLQKLKGLDVSGCNLKDTSYFGNLMQLEQLYVGGSDRLYEIKGLEQLKNLKHLDIERSQVDSIRKINVHENLRSLHLTSTEVTNLSYLDRFPYLEELRMGNTYEIEKIEGLEALQNLKQLLIRGTSIKQIEGLEQLTNLEVLDLSDNEITEIKGVSQLTKLRELNLNENPINKVENLDGLDNLELLLLETDDITDFDSTFLNNLESECHIYLYMRDSKKLERLKEEVPNSVKINFDPNYPYPTKLVWHKELFE